MCRPVKEVTAKPPPASDTFCDAGLRGRDHTRARMERRAVLIRADSVEVDLAGPRGQESQRLRRR